MMIVGQNSSELIEKNELIHDGNEMFKQRRETYQKIGHRSLENLEGTIFFRS